MPVVLLALRFVNIFAAALVAGGQVLVLLVIVPVKRALCDRESVRIHLAMLGHLTDRYMKPSGTISGLCAFALLALVPAHDAVSLVLLVVGLVGMLGVVITSRYINVPTNREMATWSLDALPADYEQRRNRWDRVHAVRTGNGLLALAGFLASALVR